VSLMYVVRHAASILALPTTVTVLVPLWIARGNVVEWATPAGVFATLAIGAGALCVAAGMGLFAWTLRLFFTKGRGTLAPWDPPTRLVVLGPYRYVRNPMITGVLLVLAGEALILRSAPHAWWAAIFCAMNLVYIPLAEEPGLERRFGEDYTLYRRNVPRLLPRLTPWTEE
jgi:protein-S-isoprenylcysteine O-methyltransferase Ste14